MPTPSASIIVIGNEILSGRTQETNVRYISNKLSSIGVKTLEVRIIADLEEEIVRTIIEVKDKFDYIFTTGGIGATHDDITVASIAKALNLPLELNQDVLSMLKDFYTKLGEELPEANKKMAYLPKGTKFVLPTIYPVPSFIVDNIYILAGSPDIMQLMLANLLSQLKKGSEIFTRSVEVMVAESKIAKDFMNLQNKYPTVDMGSYPFKKDNQYATSLVLTSTDAKQIKASHEELLSLVSHWLQT